MAVPLTIREGTMSSRNKSSLTRRRFLEKSSAIAVGTAWTAAAAGRASGLQPAVAEGAPFGPPAGPVWDMHGHLATGSGSPEQRVTRLLTFARRMGIERLTVSMGLRWSVDPEPEDFRRQNDEVMRAVRHAPDQLFGQVYLNPNHVQASLEELDRGVRDGPMVAVKLWTACLCNHANLDPIVRRAAELKAPVFQHTWWKATGNLPGESTPVDLAELAARHPGVPIVAIHVGGDWERGIRAIRPYEHVWAGLSGSDPAAGMVEMAVRELGAERVLYGSDFHGRSFASQLAKVYGAEIPDAAKRLILRENARRLLQPICDAKGIKL